MYFTHVPIYINRNKIISLQNRINSSIITDLIPDFHFQMKTTDEIRKNNPDMLNKLLSQVEILMKRKIDLN